MDREPIEATATAANDAPPARKKMRAPKLRASTVVGIVLLIAWLGFWARCFIYFQFEWHGTWIPIWPHLGLDLMFCIFAVRAWVHGENPYLTDIGDFRGSFSAPPILLPLFYWTRYFDAYFGTMIWAGVIASVIAAGVIYVLRVRETLRLWVPAYPFALALALWSTPVLFSMERGNLDVWVLICLFLAMPLMRHGRWYSEILAGLILSVGAWAKIYPGVLLFAVLPFGKWRTALACLVGIILIGVVPLDATRLFFTNAAAIKAANRVAEVESVGTWLRAPTFGPYTGPEVEVFPWGHSLTTYWPIIFGKTPLGSVPGFIGAAVVLTPLVLWVSFEIRRSRRRDALMLPYLLWVIGLGTYGLPLSFDYNLMFLILAAMALWDPRDPPWLHVLMLSVVLWWQPVFIEIDKTLFVYIKLFAILPLTILLVRRAREQTPAEELANALEGKGAVVSASPAPAA